MTVRQEIQTEFNMFMWFKVLLILLLATPVYAGLPPTRILDEGSDQGLFFKLDCVGAGIACTQSGITGTMTVSGSGASGGAPTAAPYLVTSGHTLLTAEVIVGTIPGGELGGTWTSITVDATHSGSAHHAAVTVDDTATIDMTLTTQEVKGDVITLKDLVTTSPLTGGTDDILPGADADVTIAMPQATTSADGYVVQADWDSWTDHVADNTQAHSDYLLNSGNDSSSGGLTLTGVVVSTQMQASNLASCGSIKTGSAGIMSCITEPLLIAGTNTMAATLDMNSNVLDNVTNVNSTGLLTATGVLVSVAVQTPAINNAAGTVTVSGQLDIDSGGTSGVLFGTGATADPCGTFAEGTIFYNTTGDYFCYCDGSDDLKMNDNSTACF